MSSEINEEGLLFGEGPASERAQVFLSEISEEDVEVLRERENALLQIEVSFWGLFGACCEVSGSFVLSVICVALSYTAFSHSMHIRCFCDSSALITL